jgi:hypothetical protein
VPKTQRISAAVSTSMCECHVLYTACSLPEQAVMIRYERLLASWIQGEDGLANATRVGRLFSYELSLSDSQFV